MKQSVRNFVGNLNKKTFTNNVQRVLYHLLTAEGDWVRLDRTNIPSSEARARDLRKSQYGEFNIFCRSANDLHVVGATPTCKTHYYKLGQRNLTIGKLKTVFGNIG
jgi:hypothetical protein